MKRNSVLLNYGVPLLIALLTIQSNILAAKSVNNNLFNKPVPGGGKMLLLADFFPEFPGIKWGMNFKEVKSIIKKTGANPVGLKDLENELAWDGTFDNMWGRCTVLFKEGTGLNQIVFVLYAMDKQKKVFDQYQKKLVSTLGKSTEDFDDIYGLTKMWKIKDGYIIALKKLKDAENPIIELRWIKN